MASEKIDELSIEIDYSAKTANSGIDQLKNSLKNLSDVTSSSVSGLSSVNSQLNRFAKNSENLANANFNNFSESMKNLSMSLIPLETLDTEKINNFFKTIKKIPKINEKLDAKSVEEFTAKIDKLSASMGPLSQHVATLNGNLSNLPNKLNKVTNYVSKSKNSFNGLSGVLKAINFAGISALFAKAGKTVGGFVTQSNKYVEDLNLFNVAMGESSAKAKEWIDNVSDVLGLDPTGMMRYMGVFQMISSGFGLSADNAYKMSKNLTQLTYDISSFYNINIDEAAQKVQSAISGKIFCLIYKGLYIVTHLIAGNSKRLVA